MPDYVEWKNEYSVGFEPIDAQHRTMVFLLNELYGYIMNGGVTRAQMDKLLDKVLLYTESHFEYEEKILRFAEVPNLGHHAQQHRDMEQRTKGICLALSKEIGEQLKITLNVLCDWWINHILQVDLQTMPYLLRAFK